MNFRYEIEEKGRRRRGEGEEKGRRRGGEGEGENVRRGKESMTDPFFLTSFLFSTASI